MILFDSYSNHSKCHCGALCPLKLLFDKCSDAVASDTVFVAVAFYSLFLGLVHSSKLYEHPLPWHGGHSSNRHFFSMASTTLRSMFLQLLSIAGPLNTMSGSANSMFWSINDLTASVWTTWLSLLGATSGLCFLDCSFLESWPLFHVFEAYENFEKILNSAPSLVVELQITFFNLHCVP